jgi:hyperosmotically inducible periplasmic protein
MILKKKLVIPALIISLLLNTITLAAEEKKNTRSDIWLEAQLVTSYTLNEHLNPFKIDVDVQDGVANITGSVDSAIERDLAVEIARSIDGIMEVKENLTIGPTEEPAKESAFSRQVEDATITAKVKYRLILNKNIASYDINVDTKNGVVTLSGKVDSGEKRDLAVKLAENTSGVLKVEDSLTVVEAEKMQEEGEKESDEEKSGSSMKEKMDALSQEVKDTWITTKARSLLLISSEADGARYDISTRTGKITVTGTVLSEQQAEDIQKILEDLQGVAEVENKLAVRERENS